MLFAATSTVSTSIVQYVCFAVSRQHCEVFANSQSSRKAGCVSVTCMCPWFRYLYIDSVSGQLYHVRYSVFDMSLYSIHASVVKSGLQVGLP